MTIRLYLIRHGRVDFESKQMVDTPRGPQWDPPLDEQGREQAKALAARLELVDGPTTVVVSPLTRCRQTLQPFATATGVEPRVVDDLREVFIGRWEGMRFEDILSEDEELARKFREQNAMFSLSPGGESGAQLRARVVPAVEAAMDQAGEGTVIAVTHGGVINAYLADVMGVAHDMFFLPENTSVNTVIAEGATRTMRFLNDVRHLTDPAVFARPAGAGPSRGT
jgi:broad specificity phosphatase PhoE